MMNLSKGKRPEVEGRSTMTTETDKTFRDYAIRSYRYLRLAIVVMVLSLGASVIIILGNLEGIDRDKIVGLVEKALQTVPDRPE